RHAPGHLRRADQRGGAEGLRSGDEYRVRTVPGFRRRPWRQEGAQGRVRAEQRADRVRLADARRALVRHGHVQDAPDIGGQPVGGWPAIPSAARDLLSYGKSSSLAALGITAGRVLFSNPESRIPAASVTPTLPEPRLCTAP